MRTKLLPKYQRFTEDDRDDVLISDADKIQIDSRYHFATLVADANGKYPLDTDLWIASRETTPSAWLAWRILTIGVYHAYDGTTKKTAHRVRLHNGTDHYYWDGGAWVVAGASDWNTEAEVNVNLASFDQGTIRIVVNLSTTDEDYAPALKWISYIFEGRFFAWEDILYRTLVPAIRDNIRPLTDYPVELSATTSTIGLDDYPLDSTYTIASIDSVFNHTADPDHRNDLFSSYDPGTRVITLSSSIPAGEVAWIVIAYELPVTVVQSTDYSQFARVPAVTIEGFREVQRKTLQEEQSAFERTVPLSGVKIPPAYALTFRFSIIVMATGGVELMRLAEEIVGYIEGNPLLVSKGLDERYRWRVVSEIADASAPSVSNVREARIIAEVMDVLTFTKAAETGLAPTETIRLTGDVVIDIDVG